MPSDNEQAPSKEFLKKMDSGEYDGHLENELKKLSREQLEEVAHALVDRDARRRK